MMNKARIAYLVNRYIQALLSQEESEEFSSLLLDPRYEETIKALLDELWSIPQIGITLSEEQHARILAGVQQHKPYGAPVITMHKKKDSLNTCLQP